MNRQDHELAAHQPWLRRLARRLVPSNARADDLVQDTYVTALRNAPPDAQLRPWLHAVMRKLAWGQVRSEQRRAAREEEFSIIAETAALPDELAGQGERERLTAAVAALPEPFRSTIVQRFLHGQSCAEIARRERVPAGTVRWRQARGLELLRAELAPPRRRYVIWVLPFLGASERLIARALRAVITRLGGSKLFWLSLALAAVLYAITGSVPQQTLDDVADDHRDGLALDLSSHGLAAAALDLAAVPGAPRVPAGPARDHAVPGVPDEPDEPPAVTRSELALAPLATAIDDQRGDCTWDPVHGRRCAEPARGPDRDAICAQLRGPLLAAVGLGPRAAALMSGRALALQLGCPWPADLGPSGRTSDGGRPASGKSATGDKAGENPPPVELPPPVAAPPAGQAQCDYQELDGVLCTVCPGLPPACGDKECHDRVVAEGAICTICTDQRDAQAVTCRSIPPAGCSSEMAESGLLCSTCDGQPGPPECLPASCVGTSEPGCARCTDPKGRTATTCNLTDPEYLAQFALGATSYATCSATWGLDDPFKLTCFYPGQQSCVYEDTAGGHCLDCIYPSGAWSGACGDPAAVQDDPSTHRPPGLPAPGTCETLRASDGTVTCETCTRADLLTTTSCQFDDEMSCELDRVTNGGRECIPCERRDGSHVWMCISVHGIEPVAAPPS